MILLRKLTQQPMLFLLSGLVSLLLVFPLAYHHTGRCLVAVELGYSILFIVSSYCVSRKPRHAFFAIAMTSLSSTLLSVNQYLSSMPITLTALLCQISFFVLIITDIIVHVLSFEQITADKLFGAISVYWLIGIIWGLVYTTLELAVPHSFAFTQPLIYGHKLVDHHHFYLAQFIYLSFVTMTTLGFGDIVPLSIEARSLVIIEAMLGQLYIATFVARLVGMHIHYPRAQQE